jgi:O-phosphoseryl-tRNA(Cys) synthetase
MSPDVGLGNEHVKMFEDIKKNISTKLIYNCS